MSKYNTEWFKAQMLEKDPSIEILSEYGGDKVRVKCKCKICGYEWEAVPTKLKQGKNKCPECRKNTKRKELEKDFIERASKIHNDKYDYSLVNYIDQHTKVIIICPIHGKFEQIPNAHLRGLECSKCSKRSYKYTLEEFIELAKTVHENKYNYSNVEYINIKTPIIITCKEHGDFEQSPDNHLRGNGCPKCQLKSQTKLFEKLIKSFPEEKILFEVGRDIVPWLGLQRFDIYFPKHNIAVEYNGRQHYIPVDHFGGKLGLAETQERDELKRNKCKENNCTLFEVKYNYSEEDYNNLVTDIKKIVNT